VAQQTTGAARKTVPTRRREALENAWMNAEGAEHADAAGRPGDRDVRSLMAIMWALIAIGEQEK
jgi:hypothetical protein